MVKRDLLNIGLLGLTIALLLLTIIEPGHEKPATVPTLLEFAPEAVTTIAIERQDLATLAFARQDNDWMMTSPETMPANGPLLDELRKIAKDKCPLSYPVSELELDKVDLQPPLAHLTLNDHVLAFGGTDALDRRRYVRHEDTVHLCVDRYYHLLTGDVQNFQSHRPDSAE